VDTIDAAGIGSLVSLQASGIYLTLVNPTEHVRELLRVTQLDSIFEISQSAAVPEAIEESITLKPCATVARAGA
jgi:anti-anti-sigma regulatory factor